MVDRGAFPPRSRSRRQHESRRRARSDRLYDLVKMARDKVLDHEKHADDVLKDLGRETATGGSGPSNPSSGGTGR